jgi:hypothetical protein
VTHNTPVIPKIFAISLLCQEKKSFSVFVLLIFLRFSNHLTRISPAAGKIFNGKLVVERVREIGVIWVFLALKAKL